MIRQPILIVMFLALAVMIISISGRPEKMSVADNPEAIAGCTPQTVYEKCDIIGVNKK